MSNLARRRRTGLGNPIGSDDISRGVGWLGIGALVGAGLGAALSTPRNYPSTLISVAGGLANGMTYSLDGANHNDPYGNVNLPLPFPDAMQEFKVETNALPAQYGYHSAAAVNAVTKSGTNQVHGDGFEFLRECRHRRARQGIGAGPSADCAHARAIE